MTQVWICASCRRALYRQYRWPPQNKPAQRATYIPFEGSKHGQDVETNHENGERGASNRRESSSPAQRPRELQLRRDRSLEDDFLDRISQDRAHGPYSRSTTLEKDQMTAGRSFPRTLDNVCSPRSTLISYPLY